MTSADLARLRLLDAAAGLLCKHSGASLADVADAAGVSRTTLHRQFPTRHDLLYALAEYSLERVQAALADVQPTPEEPVETVFTRVASSVLPLATEMRFLDIGADVWDLPEMVERWYDVSRPFEELVRQAKTQGQIRPDVSTAWIVDLFTAAIWAASSGISDGRIARRDAIELIVDTVLHGIAAPGGAS